MAFRTESSRKLTTREIQALSLEIMTQIHSFCVNNNIQYSLAAGTMIGAVRHGGFIPWDDDIDIIMTRPNFDRFCKEFQSDSLHLMAPGDKGYYLKFARVFDKQKTVVRNHRSPFSDRETGLWIDIFPIDNVPDDDKAFLSLAHKCEQTKLFSWRIRDLKGETERNSKSDISVVRKAFRRLRILKKYMGAYIHFGHCKTLHKVIAEEAEMLRSIDGPGHYMGGLCFAKIKYTHRYSAEWFDDYIEVPFENHRFLMLSAYDKLLTMQYGDYMTIPPVEKRVVHNFYDVCWR